MHPMPNILKLFGDVVAAFAAAEQTLVYHTYSKHKSIPRGRHYVTHISVVSVWLYHNYNEFRIVIFFCQS